jgi:hypothetical protein
VVHVSGRNWLTSSTLVDDHGDEDNAMQIDWCLQPLAHAGSSLADFSTLKKEAIPSSETSVYTISTLGHTSEDDILHSHRRENFISYIMTESDLNFM